MGAKEFCKLYDIKNRIMKAGQPYTFKDNWRTQSTLFGGWAMCYVIGIDEKGNKVFGIGMLDTVGSLYSN